MKFFVREAGDAHHPMLVFIHGGGVSGWMWDRQVEYFRNRYRVLIPDLPGHGRSSQEAFQSIPLHAAELLQMIEERRTEGQSVIVIGFSLGAQIVMEMLSCSEKGKIDGAIIVSGLAKPMKVMLPLLKPVIRLTMPVTKYEWFAKLQARELYIPEEQFAAYYKESKQMKTDNLISVIDASLSYELPETFPQHTVSTLVLVGSKEKSDMLQSAAILTSRNSKCIGYRCEGVGHGISLAQPDVFHNIIERWLEGQELIPQISQLMKIS